MAKNHKMTVYLSGPIRGIPRKNYPAFDDVRDRAKKVGYRVISPVDLNRKDGIFEETQYTEHQDATSMLRDYNALAKCDCIILLPGWLNSKGALAELAFAKYLGLPVLDSMTFKRIETTLRAKVVKP